MLKITYFYKNNVIYINFLNTLKEDLAAYLYISLKLELLQHLSKAYRNPSKHELGLVKIQILSSKFIMVGRSAKFWEKIIHLNSVKKYHVF